MTVAELIEALTELDMPDAIVSLDTTGPHDAIPWEVEVDEVIVKDEDEVLLS